jgi:hypothetical protein
VQTIDPVELAAPEPDPSPVERRRASNDRIAAAAVAHRFDRVTAVPFICECEDADCGELLRLTLDELKSARKLGRTVVWPGHARPGAGVRSERGYWVVD